MRHVFFFSDDVQRCRSFIVTSSLPTFCKPGLFTTLATWKVALNCHEQSSLGELQGNGGNDSSFARLTRSGLAKVADFGLGCSEKLSWKNDVHYLMISCFGSVHDQHLIVLSCHIVQKLVFFFWVGLHFAVHSIVTGLARICKMGGAQRLSDFGGTPGGDCRLFRWNNLR